jgi:hypothetical protein
LIPKEVQNADFAELGNSGMIWFGTRGSEVQILSPRPLKSITYSGTNILGAPVANRGLEQDGFPKFGVQTTIGLT